jgi:hypothetical protein
MPDERHITRPRPRPLSRRLLAAAGVALALAAAIPAAGAQTATDAATAKTRVLSNERTGNPSYWTTPNDRGAIRRSPSNRARVVGHLRLETENRQPDVYLALKLHTAASGREWVLVRIPGRPNGRTGWVARGSLGPLHRNDRLLVIDRQSLRATLFKAGRRIWRAPIGVGARSTPTPGGHFYIRERLKSFRGGTIYGPVAFGTSAYSGLSEWPRGGVIGIHGTNEPRLIPGRPSHGCTRVRNGDMLRLWRLARIGTPIHIR